VGRNTRWLIVIHPTAFALFAKPDKADTLGEWIYSQSRPISGSNQIASSRYNIAGDTFVGRNTSGLSADQQ